MELEEATQLLLLSGICSASVGPLADYVLILAANQRARQNAAARQEAMDAGARKLLESSGVRVP